jgi:transcriptional/translational regulatory protein YebC/TACO1
LSTIAKTASSQKGKSSILAAKSTGNEIVKTAMTTAKDAAVAKKKIDKAGKKAQATLTQKC